MFRGTPVHNSDVDIADYAARVWQQAAKEKFPGSRFVYDFDEDRRHEAPQPRSTVFDVSRGNHAVQSWDFGRPARSRRH